jgi:hypothetical protein
MKAKPIIIAIIAISIFTVFLNTGYVFAQRECGAMKWGDKDHGDNNPSESKLKQAVKTESLCELAKGIDHSKYSNHDAVNWKQFKTSPAFLQATDEQQECLTFAHKHGNGMNGLGGYEIMDCGIGKGYHE